MISDIVLWSGVSSAATAAGFYTAPKLQTWFRFPGFHKGGLIDPSAPVEEQAVEVGPKNLSERHIRERLTLFLAAHQITGDADVRNGHFLAPVPASKLEPLAIMMRRAWNRIQSLKNPAACSLYIRDSENDRFLLLDELDLADVGEMLRVMERVVSDRKKSRSLYKGMTDEEFEKIAVAATARYLKDHGEFQRAIEVATGNVALYGTEIAVARAALELAFQVKRPES
jgi:hypothetical protein